MSQPASPVRAVIGAVLTGQVRPFGPRDVPSGIAKRG